MSYAGYLAMETFLKQVFVESVEWNHGNSTHNMSLINMATRFSMRSQHALQVNNMHNKYTHGHNRTVFTNKPDKSIITVTEMKKWEN